MSRTAGTVNPKGFEDLRFKGFGTKVKTGFQMMRSCSKAFPGAGDPSECTQMEEDLARTFRMNTLGTGIASTRGPGEAQQGTRDQLSFWGLFGSQCCLLLAVHGHVTQGLSILLHGNLPWLRLRRVGNLNLKVALVKVGIEFQVGVALCLARGNLKFQRARHP